MVLEQSSEIREVTGLDQMEIDLIKSFLQGAVYCWIKNRKNEKFAARDLVGGENSNWEGTPLQKLYDKHISAGKDESSAIENAAKDLGWILKAVINTDRRTFKNTHEELVNKYIWTSGE